MILLFLMVSCNYSIDQKEEEQIATRRPLMDEHELFITTFYPIVHAENSYIISQRTHLQWLRERHWFALRFGNHLHWLNQLGRFYKFDSLYFQQSLTRSDFEQRIDSLLIHVDMIPDKLVMAQAVIESGWGKSYLAKKANNYFGMRCFKKDCGIPPHGVHSPVFWHRKYPTATESVKDYMLNLNTANAYKKLRKMRGEQRMNGTEPDPLELAETLDNYSEIGREYIRMLHEVMKNYLPEDLEAFIRQKPSQ
ncbi:MAG: glucosaminidase domain-containing protein [Bacteroidales bacterium]|nr:glucosaminidase domain-containing protein [Bacteroidales bacterium]